ncbi:MAG: Dabb family protein [Cyclobacteriaceae bacterium]
MKRSTQKIVAIFYIFATLSACGEHKHDHQEKPKTQFNMLQHNVYFYLNPDVTEEEKRDFLNGLNALVSIENIHHAEIGVPAETERREVTDHDFAYSIFTWFETMEDHEVYQNHPDHLEFIEKYKHLWKQVKVYDSQLAK